VAGVARRRPPLARRGCPAPGSATRSPPPVSPRLARCSPGPSSARRALAGPGFALADDSGTHYANLHNVVSGIGLVARALMARRPPHAARAVVLGTDHHALRLCSNVCPDGERQPGGHQACQLRTRLLVSSTDARKVTPSAPRDDGGIPSLPGSPAEPVLLRDSDGGRQSACGSPPLPRRELRGRTTGPCARAQATMAPVT